MFVNPLESFHKQLLAPSPGLVDWKLRQVCMLFYERFDCQQLLVSGADPRDVRVVTSDTILDQEQKEQATLSKAQEIVSRSIDDLRKKLHHAQSDIAFYKQQLKTTANKLTS